MASNVKIPDSGYMIALHGGNYVQAFRTGRGALGDSDALKKATRAAEELAEKERMSVDIVRVSARGQDRYVVDEILPRSWSTRLARQHATKKKPFRRSYQYRAVVTGKGILIGGGKRHVSSWFDTKKEADDWAWAVSEGNQAAGRSIAFVTIERKHDNVIELIKWAHAGEVEI